MATMNSRSSTPQGDRDEDLLEEFILDGQLQDLSDRTLATYRSHLAYFLDWYDGDVTAVDRTKLKKFLSNLKHERTARDGSTGLATSTLSGYFSALNSFYKFLAYEGYIVENPVPSFRERYLESTHSSSGPDRQLISVEEMSMLAHSILKVRNRALVLVFAKTGIRRNELIHIDLDDVNWEERTIKLKPTPKRSNLTVFFDAECARCLERWRQSRDENGDVQTDALFTNQYGTRLKRNGVYTAVTNHAEAVGLHDPDSDDIEERFTPHCFRHWFTTHLRRSGMKREFIKELRGDTRGDAVDIYDHIDRAELKQSYLAHIPTLGL